MGEASGDQRGHQEPLQIRARIPLLFTATVLYSQNVTTWKHAPTPCDHQERWDISWSGQGNKDQIENTLPVIQDCEMLNKLEMVLFTLSFVLRRFPPATCDQVRLGENPCPPSRAAQARRAGLCGLAQRKNPSFLDGILDRCRLKSKGIYAFTVI